MGYTRDFSNAPSQASANAVFYGGTQYSGIRSMIGLLRHWRRVRKAMQQADGYLGHHIWYRYPFTFGTFSFFASQRQMMEFAGGLRHQAAANWMYLPGVSEGSFFRILSPERNGYTNGIWAAEPTAAGDNGDTESGGADTPPESTTLVFDDEPSAQREPTVSETPSQGLRDRIPRLPGVDRVLLGTAETVLRVPQARATLDSMGRDGLPAGLIHRLGEERAEQAVRAARNEVPALQEFYASLGPNAPHVMIGNERVPTTDKQRYIRRYSITERCVDGRVPARGVTIDESSGSSGTPNNWLRTTAERRVVHANIQHYVYSWLGDEPYITINAFSLGAWSTGLNMGAALERGSVIKNTGPDPKKIIETLRFFGTSQRYLICAYPPFLKHLIDVAAESNLDLSRYRLAALVGGEGMSEGLRDYLRPAIDPIFSGYGASDVEIGLAGETPLSVALRRLAADDEQVREALFGRNPRLPMLFQYNPFEYYVNATEDDELVYTISRPGVLSPVIAYNLHDEGGVATYEELRERLTQVGVDLDSIAKEHPRSAEAPFVWVFGRKDSTVSVMGANVYPEDIEAALYDHPELARMTKSYCLGLVDLDDGLRRATASFEILGDITSELSETFDKAIFDGIHRRSPDFREAYKNRPDLVRPLIQLYSEGQGPFADEDWRIKQRRLIAQPANV